MRVLMHPDGGPCVGLGHASRCSALSTALIRAGHLPLVLVDPASDLGDFFCQLHVPHVEATANPVSLRAQAERMRADAIVIDSYRWSEADFFELRQSDLPIVVFDDQGKRILPVEAVINGAPGAFGLHYQVLQHTQCLLGPQYQVVRDEFRDVPIRKPAQPLKNLLVLVGGDDLLGLLPSLAIGLNRLAESACPAFRVELICGPFCAVPETSLLPNITVTVRPRDLRERMISADIALSASGQTLFELARCGTPTVAFCAGEDQILNLTALANSGVVWNAGRADQAGWFSVVQEGIQVLAADLTLRDLMANRAQSLIDGYGSDRLASAIAEVISMLRTRHRAQTSA